MLNYLAIFEDYGIFGEAQDFASTCQVVFFRLVKYTYRCVWQ